MYCCPSFNNRNTTKKIPKALSAPQSEVVLANDEHFGQQLILHSLQSTDYAQKDVCAHKLEQIQI